MKTPKRIKLLEQKVADKSLPKSERKAARKALERLVGGFDPSPASGTTPAEATETPALPTDDEAKRFAVAFLEANGITQGERKAKQDAEVAAQWAARTRIDHKIEDPADLIVDGEPITEAGWTLNQDGTYTDAAKAVAAAEGQTLPALGPIGLEPAADPVLQNGNGQAMIHYTDPVTGAEKVKGYTRVTTYIDGLDDKTVLTKWKMRTLLEGAAIEHDDWRSDGTRIEKVSRAVRRLDEALADIDSRERDEGELLELRRQELLKEHRTLLEGIADELMELGGAHEKAIKGTNLHRLTELVDQGLPLPDNTTASDRRDVEAYQATIKTLGLEVLWTEKRVVLDDIQVSGTMDRAYLVKLPGMQRRIRVVGDLKTGSVSWGQGKIGMQLALYAKGFGYDWANPLERERLSLSKAHGLLIHLPQGEGKCDVYLVDLELANQGLDLAAKVREWRRIQRRAYDLKKPLGVQE